MAVSQDLYVPSSIVKESVVRGHHVYKAVWTPVIGELQPLRVEDDNEHDDHAVTVVKGGDVVGYVLRAISRVAWFFLKSGGNTTCSNKFLLLCNCEVRDRLKTNYQVLSTQTCRSRGVSITMNSCLGPGHYSGPASVKDLSF